MSERILVAGCGAVGSVFACLLREAGHAVTVLARGPHVDAIAQQGLAVTGIWGSHRADGIRVASPAQLESGYDAVLVVCKSYQTEELLAEIGRQGASSGVVISLQNGLGNIEKIGRVCDGGHVLGGRVIFGAEILAPGRVAVTVEADPVLLGRPGGESDLAGAWAQHFAAAGIPCEATADIDAVLWAKVFYNAALNPLGALLGLRYGELAADARRRRIMDRIVGEAFRVAEAERVALAWRDVGEYLDVFYGRLVPSTADHRSSMLQDMERGRPTEIDAICGEICRRGDRHGTDCALNRLLAVLVEARSNAPAWRPS